MNERMAALEQKRRKWVEATRENGFREGIADLLAHQYSRKTHFIFELLQNAEDARATAVEFCVGSDWLVFSHNGERLFSEDNIERITGIGQSDKQGDYTQIGKHGIGFKAVFAYTHAPRIHSGDKHFEIQDIVLPRFLAANEIPRDMKAGETRIVLPFDSAAIPQDHRFRELIEPETARVAISEALADLSIRTLLFLQHIEEIRCVFPNNETKTYLRETTFLPDRSNARNVTVTDGDIAETWVVFTRNLAVVDDGISHQCSVEVGYHLREEKVVPADNTELVVYFPTEKKTELGFLIQGPFKTTKARDNIALDSEANNQMILTAACLAADSLEDLRDLGLLNVESYNALPLKSSTFEDEGTRFFKPVYETIREALRTNTLLPRHGGGFIAADQARLARGAALAKLFSPEQLGAIFGSGDLFWLDTAITADRMPDLRNYLAGIRMPRPLQGLPKPLVPGIVRTPRPFPGLPKPLVPGIEIDAKDLAAKLTSDFFSKQNEEWLMRFYEYIRDNFTAFMNTPFIRLANGSHVSPGSTDKPNAYLSSGGAAEMQRDEFPTVIQTLASKPSIRNFLRDTVKLREPNRVDVALRCILPEYRRNGHAIDPHGDRYASDLKELSSAYQKATAEDRERLLSVMKRTNLVACVPAANPNNPPSWRMPDDSNLYRRSAELEQWFFGNTQDAAWFPAEIVDRSLAPDIKNALQYASGTLRKRSTLPRRNYYGHTKPEGNFDPEADISGLSWVLSNPREGNSVYLWNFLLAHSDLIKGQILVSPNKQFPSHNTERREEFSPLGAASIKHAWLPGRNAPGFHRPAELTILELPDAFERDTPRAEAVSRALGMKQPEQVRALEQLGRGNQELTALLEIVASATDEQVEQLKKWMELLSPQESPPKPAPPFKDALKHLSRPQSGTIPHRRTSPGPISNPGRYEGALKDAVGEAVKKHLSTPRTVTFSAVRDQPSNEGARRFLYEQYQGHCQVTGDTFPKASANAEGISENYFEACALLSYSNADYLNDPGNMLCVSADTAAKLKHGSCEWLDDVDEIIQRFNEREPGGTASARLRLAGEEAQITWSERHFMRFLALWDKA